MPAIIVFPKTLPGDRGRAMRSAYKPVKPSAPVPTTLHEMQSLYSPCFPCSNELQVGGSGEGVGGGVDFGARGSPDILTRSGWWCVSRRLVSRNAVGKKFVLEHVGSPAHDGTH